MSPDSILSLWAAVWPYITAACMIASAIDAGLPQPAPGSHWLPVRKLVSFVAVNVGAASNGGQPSFTTWLLRIVQPVLTAQGMIPTAAAPEVKIAVTALAPSASQPQPEHAPQQQQPQGAALGSVAGSLLVVIMAAFLMSACSSAPSADDVRKVVTQANQSVAEASQDLPKACAVVSGLHAAFEVAAVLSEDASAQADTERAVYDGLVTGKGLCSPDTLAHPPEDVGGAVASVVKQALQIQALLKPAVEAVQK